MPVFKGAKQVGLQDLKSKAMGKVNASIKRGKLTRPTSCSLCDSPAKTIVCTYLSTKYYPHETYEHVEKSNIVAHHWKGYEGENATDVIWICNRCNRILYGPEYHDGSFTIPELRQIIADYYDV